MRTPISRRLFVSSLMPALARAAERSPNLLVFLADGWRACTLGSAGDAALIAPHLERLARSGQEFPRACAARPVAGGGSVSPILSGCFAHRTDAAAVLTTALAGMGYQVGDFRAGEQDALRFLEANRQQVFAAFCQSPLATRPAARFEQLYGGRRLSFRLNVPDAREAELRPALQRYYAAITEADARLGRLLDAIDTAGLAADTIVVVASHCGEMLGSQDLTGADEPFDEALRVPLVIRYPRRLKAGLRPEFPVSLTDLAPTLLDLCGAQVPGGLHGRNLAPLLTGSAAEPPESVFAQGRLGTSGAWRAVVRGLDKLIVNNRQEVVGLYNLGLDPHEQENLARPRAYELTRAELKVVLQDWMSRTGDWATRAR
jgi:arylsulfatase A-like enzyme